MFDKLYSQAVELARRREETRQVAKEQELAEATAGRQGPSWISL